MKLKLPKDCIKSDVCKYVGDEACWNGCDYRVEKLTSYNSDYAKCPHCGSQKWTQVSYGDNKCGKCGKIYPHFA